MLPGGSPPGIAPAASGRRGTHNRSRVGNPYSAFGVSGAHLPSVMPPRLDTRVRPVNPFLRPMLRSRHGRKGVYHGQISRCASSPRRPSRPPSASRSSSPTDDRCASQPASIPGPSSASSSCSSKEARHAEPAADRPHLAGDPTGRSPQIVRGIFLIPLAAVTVRTQSRPSPSSIHRTRSTDARSG